MADLVSIREEAERFLGGLAKPKGSLGRLEQLGVQLCVAQGKCPPSRGGCGVVVFAADHGAASNEAVSAFPQAVTKAMVATILSGSAAVTTLARNAGCEVELVCLGLNCPKEDLEFDASEIADGVRLVNAAISHGTKNFAVEAAMSKEQLDQALEQGRAAARRAQHQGLGILAVGELGIGNTSSAAALAARLLNIDAERVVGPGTGLDSDGVRAKIDVVKRALSRNGSTTTDPLSALMDLGGFELVAMAGCFLECAKVNMAAVVDGYISSCAALAACRVDPAVAKHLIFATLSAEPGHRHVLDAIQEGTQPLLDWQLRLGEASGAALALPLITAAAGLFHEMATLEEVLRKIPT
mmetsp:Transcript_3076/g.5841  ORF Transcript_3076/g.5841 Transcript_3076/m.5841 type:complete len:354 (+) Transcript_3076:37-1098(+)